MMIKLTAVELQDKLTNLTMRLKELRDDINGKLDEHSDCIQRAEQICEQATTTNNILESKLANLSHEEKEWQEIKAKLATTSSTGKVVLDVGGEKYITSVETLTKEKDTFFTAMFSEQWQLERDPQDKSIFIDRDGKLFQHILAYLRTNHVPSETLANESLRQLLIIEAQYFHLHRLVHLLNKPDRKDEEEKQQRDEQFQKDQGFPHSTLLQAEQKIRLNEFYDRADQRWELIYKASRDGFDANAFHAHCNEKGATITIIQSKNGSLFGGFTSISWTSSNYSYKNDTTAFLFTLVNPHQIPPTKYPIDLKNVHFAVCHHSGCGATFGGGHDLCLASNSNVSNASYTSFPHTYSDTTGKGNNTFTGTRNFITVDVEVYRIV